MEPGTEFIVELSKHSTKPIFILQTIHIFRVKRHDLFIYSLRDLKLQ